MIGASRKMLRPLHNCPAHTIEELFQDAERRIILLPTMFCKNIPSNPLRSLFRSESIFRLSTRVLHKLENYVTEIVQSLPKRTLYMLKNHHNICSKQFCVQHMLASCSISSICLTNFFSFFQRKRGKLLFSFSFFCHFVPSENCVLLQHLVMVLFVRCHHFQACIINRNPKSTISKQEKKQVGPTET